MAPKASVITTVYNGEKFLSQCVESILNQTYQDFEFIIINDGSTDGTPAILDKYKDPRLKIFHHKNQGLTKSLIFGESVSRGSLIARLDADDFALPQRLEKQIQFMDENPEVVLCGSRYEELMDGQTRTQQIPFIWTDLKLRKKMSCFNPFPHSTVMFRKSAYNKADGYDPEIRYGQDFDLWVRLLETGRGHNLDEILTTIRFHSESISSQKTKEQLLSALKTRWKAYLKFSGNPVETLYCFSKSLLVLASPARLKQKLQR